MISDARTLADQLEQSATLVVHQKAAKELRRMIEEIESLKQERDASYQLGRSYGLYLARNTLNETFGL